MAHKSGSGIPTRIPTTKKKQRRSFRTSEKRTKCSPIKNSGQSMIEEKKCSKIKEEAEGTIRMPISSSRDTFSRGAFSRVAFNRAEVEVVDFMFGTVKVHTAIDALFTWKSLVSTRGTSSHVTSSQIQQMDVVNLSTW